MTSDVRPSPIAGTWYPESPEELMASVDQLLESAHIPELSGRILGLIAPHAGHRYSGHVAAHAFRCLEKTRPEIIAIVSPLHALHTEQVLTTAHEAYATPLGEVPVDRRLVERFESSLADSGNIVVHHVRLDPEHSLEIELPFLQRVLKKPFRLIPLMLRDQSPEVAEAVGHSLAAVLAAESGIIVASSDLSHFYPDPIARKLDQTMLSRIEAFDPAGVLQAEKEGVGFACGRAAVAALLWAARDLGADSVQVLCYENSGDVTGDYHSVVGYGAAVITQTHASNPTDALRQ